MNQSAFIGGALLAGFVLFLAANDRLGDYAAVLWGATGAQVPSGGGTAPGLGTPATSGGGGITDILGSVADVLPQALMLAGGL